MKITTKIILKHLSDKEMHNAELKQDAEPCISVHCQHCPYRYIDCAIIDGAEIKINEEKKQIVIKYDGAIK